MSELRDQVEEWLQAIGCSPELQPDPDVRWHIGFNYPAGSTEAMHVVAPPNKQGILIATVTSIAPKHVKAFEQLSDGEKRDFQLDFRRELNRIEADYQIRGSDGPRDCPEEFQISSSRYPDGLTLDSFARSVGAVFKTKLAGVLFIQKRLEGRGLNGGGQFDFERLGV